MGKKNKQDIVPLKPKDMMHMKCIGALTDEEFTAIQNLQGRGLKASYDNGALYFKNGQTDYAVRIRRRQPVAVVFKKGCCDDAQVSSYTSALIAAGYAPNHA